MSDLLPQERIALKDFLIERFSIGELEDIVFDLGLSHESFPHDSREHFARELFLYCERRSILSSLVIEILCRRTDAQQRFSGLMAKLEPSPRKKVQILLPSNWLTIPEQRLAEIVAQHLRNIFPSVLAEDIAIMRAAPDSTALVGLPVEAASVLIQSTNRHELPGPIHQAVDFESLSLERQMNWRSLVVKLKPERTQVVAKAGDLVVQETIGTAQVLDEDTSHK